MPPRPAKICTFPVGKVVFVKRLRSVIACCLAACLATFVLCGCTSSDSSSASTSTSVEYTGTKVTLGNLRMVVYETEIVFDTGGYDCLAIKLHVTNTGSNDESVMGTYNISRHQGTNQLLKVAVAYDTNGNSIHTAQKRIKPGETQDVVMCFRLISTAPVTVVFGNANRGVTETSLTFRIS